MLTNIQKACGCQVSFTMNSLFKRFTLFLKISRSKFMLSWISYTKVGLESPTKWERERDVDAIGVHRGYFHLVVSSGGTHTNFQLLEYYSVISVRLSRTSPVIYKKRLSASSTRALRVKYNFIFKIRHYSVKREPVHCTHYWNYPWLVMTEGLKSVTL